MLHVILLILKIIGILLLCILGALLLILLTVLLVPIRYKAYAEHGEELLLVNARASWLLQLIRVRVTHIEGVLHIWVKVLWFTLYDNLKPRKPKAEKVRKKAVKTKDVRRKEIKKSKTQIKDSGKKQVSVKTVNTASKSNTGNETVAERKEVQTKIITADKKQQENPTMQQRTEIEKRLISPQAAGPDISDMVADNAKKERTVKDEKMVLIEKSDPEEQSEKKEKLSILQKILSKAKAIKERIKNFFLGIKNKVKKIFETAANIKHKFGLISDFIKDKLNREGFQITYSSLKKLLKHILPKKLRSRILFGTGDPCSTGQALGAMSILYSFYGDKVQITPDFENKVFEGKHYARGRIRLVTILIIVVKLILDKRFQQLKRNFQLLKEAL